MLLMVVLYACSEADIESTTELDADDLETILPKDDVRDGIYTSLAQNLAAGLQNEDVKSFIKEKSLERFDGDYNFLFETTKNENVTISTNGRSVQSTFGEILIPKDERGRGTSGLLDTLRKNYPLLQIALPQLEIDSAESWDVEETPLVAFIPSDFDEGNADGVIPAFDANGNYHELSGIEEPDALVIVISDNERLIAVEKASANSGRSPVLIGDCPILVQPYFENETHHFFLKEDVYPIISSCGGGGYRGGGGSGGGSGGGGSSGGSQTCDRDRKDKTELLYKAKFKDMSTLRGVERWANGRPEVVYYVTRAVYNRNGVHTFSTIGPQQVGNKNWSRRPFLKKPRTTWKTLNHDLFKWNPARNGDEMAYTWIEEDNPWFEGSATVSLYLDVDFLGTNIGDVQFDGNASFSIGGQDDHIGKNYVYYCDNTDGNGTLYRGPMHMYLKQRN